jgi:hypothetical protein
LPDSRHVHPGALRQAQAEDWTVISMKNEWKHTFAFEK